MSDNRSTRRPSIFPSEVDRDLDVLDEVPTVDGRLVVLAARRRPLDRPAQPAGQREADGLLGVDVELRAEPTPHIRRDHPELVLRDAGDERQEDADEVRHLGCRPERERVGSCRRVRDHRPRLHRVGDQALVDVAALEHDVRLGLGRLVVAVLLVEGVADVGAEILVHEGGPGCYRLLHVEHDRQRLVVDLDGLQRVRRPVAARRDHDRDGVTDVAHRVTRHRVVLRRLGVLAHRPGHRQAAERRRSGRCRRTPRPRRAARARPTRRRGSAGHGPSATAAERRAGFPARSHCRSNGSGR